MITLLYIYISIFTVYFLVLAAVSMKSERKVRDKFLPTNANLCVVVYANGASDTLENLLKQLKNQTYARQHYTIYAILDKCENIPEVTLQSDLNVNVINVDNLEPIGKSQAYSIIAAKLHEAQGLDAFVFLDAKNYVDGDFLTNVNYYLSKYDVINPMVNYLPQKDTLTFWQNVKSAYSRYCSKFISKTRTRLGLTNIINTDSFVIKRDILYKMECFDFRNIISEVQYTLKLAKEGVKVAFVDDLKVYTSIEKFDSRIPSLSQRLGIFWSSLLLPQNWTVKEFVLSLAAPNWLVCFLAYFIVLSHAYIFPFYIDYSTVLITAIVFMIACCVSFLNSKLYPKEYLYLFVYPVYSVGHMIYNFPLIRGIRSILKKTAQKPVVETMTTNVIVSDGKCDHQCQIELTSIDGMAKVTFINNGKKYTTKNTHFRMTDALRELSSKLNDKGLTLKTCQNCKYFQSVADGTTNMIKGTCNCQFTGRVQGDIIPTLIWNTCPKFEEQNIVPLF